MPWKRRPRRRLLVLSATAAVCTGTMGTPATASTNIVAAGNSAHDITMVNSTSDVGATAETVHTSGLGNGLIQVPVDRPDNRGAGGSLLFSDRELKTEVTAVVWER
ncbi:hypothetical protein [Streptomyces spiramenti]|uniref:Uncharacterized protein n=1 Tax=Streptomyces spiramenti TaxID=2720606 RepID=A0ABX1AMW8_9ACTN|nr:hypothetical protein [Streptomyces spiramenti]NJP67615.1 hypothetical protein [Streptomyces spiramenti]